MRGKRKDGYYILDRYRRVIDKNCPYATIDEGLFRLKKKLSKEHLACFYLCLSEKGVYWCRAIGYCAIGTDPMVVFQVKPCTWCYGDQDKDCDLCEGYGVVSNEDAPTWSC